MAYRKANNDDYHYHQCLYTKADAVMGVFGEL